MANVDGRWDCVIRIPFGNRRGILTVSRDGDRFRGELSGDLGSKAIAGTIEGDTLIWTVPAGSTLPMAVDCRATVAGNRIEGHARAGAYGAFPLSGERIV